MKGDDDGLGASGAGGFTVEVGNISLSFSKRMVCGPGSRTRTKSTDNCLHIPKIFYFAGLYNIFAKYCKSCKYNC